MYHNFLTVLIPCFSSHIPASGFLIEDVDRDFGATPLAITIEMYKLNVQYVHKHVCQSVCVDIMVANLIYITHMV